MTNPTPSINKLITDARRAIEAGRPDEARPLLRQAAHLAPDDSRTWLLLAGIAESPRERRTYLAQARRLDANSRPAAVPVAAPPSRPRPASRPRRSLWAGMALLLLLVLAAGALLALTPAGRNMLGSVVGRVSALAGVGGVVPLEPTAADPVPTAPAATAAPLAVASSVAALPPPTEPPVFPTKGVMPGGQPLPTWTPTSEPTPTLAPTMTPSPSPEPSPTPEPIPLSSGAPAPRPPGVADGERWINVNLTSQVLVAYEGDTPVYETLVSSGLPMWPTVTGQFRTYMKYESQTMNGYLLGYDYFLPDVPYVMYFFEDYAIHGTYWHSNFGTPMSHGCVNVSTPDAGWLFNWAPVGTVVNVHY